MKRILSFVLCAVMLLSCVAVTSFAADDAVDAVISQIDAIGEVKYQVRTEAETRSALKLTNIPKADFARPYFKGEEIMEVDPDNYDGYKFTVEFSYDSFYNDGSYVPCFGFTALMNRFIGYRFDQERWVIADGGCVYNINSAIQKKDEKLVPGVVYKLTIEVIESTITVFVNDEQIFELKDDSTWNAYKQFLWFNPACVTANIFSMSLTYCGTEHAYTGADLATNPFSSQTDSIKAYVSTADVMTYTVADSNAAITAAETAYAALTDEQKAAVTNYSKLVAARTTYSISERFGAIDVDAAFDAATVVTGGGKGRKYHTGMAQIPFGGDNETPGTFHYTIAQNKGEIDLSAQILIEVTNAESKRAGMHFGNFSGQMFGYCAYYKDFYVGGVPFNDNGCGNPVGSDTVLLSNVAISENVWHTLRIKLSAQNGGNRVLKIWLDGVQVLQFNKLTENPDRFYLQTNDINVTWADLTATSGDTTVTANFESDNPSDWLLGLEGAENTTLVDVPENVTYDLSKLLDVAKAYKVVAKTIAKVPADAVEGISNLDFVKSVGDRLVAIVDTAKLANDLDQQDVAEAIISAANSDVIYNGFADKAKVEDIRDALYLAQEGKFLNSWTTELSIAGWEEGKGEAAPVAAAAYGAVTFTYSTAADGEYSAEAPTAAGKYFVKAAVAETKAYSGLESAPVEFEITAKSVTLGDLNNDGEVNAKDLIILIRVNAGWEIDYNNDAADMNADGSINMKDIILLINAIK